ncbi:hypothetical protein [Xanthomonas vesicatoria]|uniref:hypothetical protein n=1 Tax=Xanthomonas vesicatoria TaxID=56460 RepID=UPI000ACA4BE0|nr:hypothetical protein [Xanthomonas vesicatoria]
MAANNAWRQTQTSTSTNRRTPNTIRPFVHPSRVVNQQTTLQRRQITVSPHHAPRKPPPASAMPITHTNPVNSCAAPDAFHDT